MLSSNTRNHFSTYLLVLAGLIVLFTLEGSAATFAQEDIGFIRNARVFETDDVNPSNPAGLAVWHMLVYCIWPRPELPSVLPEKWVIKNTQQNVPNLSS